MIESPPSLTPATLAPPWSAKERALSARRARVTSLIRSIEKRHADLVARAAQLADRHAEALAERDDIETLWREMRERRSQGA